MVPNRGTFCYVFTPIRHFFWLSLFSLPVCTFFGQGYYIKAYYNFLLPPVNADDHEYEGGEDVAASPEHHEDLAHDVSGVPLNGQPPEGLHRQRDEADDRVGQGEVKHQVVYIGPGLGRGQRALPAGDHQGDAVQYYAN